MTIAKECEKPSTMVRKEVELPELPKIKIPEESQKAISEAYEESIQLRNSNLGKVIKSKAIFAPFVAIFRKCFGGHRTQSGNNARHA